MTAKNSLTLCVFMVLLAGCSLFVTRSLNEKFGEPDPTRYEVTKNVGSLSYEADVKPILESRCVVCHACYDAPCQLKLGSWEGLIRGASPDAVYNASRLSAAEPSRLFMDAHSVPEWRDKGFFPVLNERNASAEADIEGSVLARLLKLKADNPLPEDPRLDPSEFDLGTERSDQCPRIETFDLYALKNPLRGMPYALPALAETEHEVILDWLAQGAPRGEPPVFEPPSELAVWERFFNREGNKARLMSRYMYEHLFLANLHFDDGRSNQFYRLVRSVTPPGQPVQRIATRRPYDDPGVAVFYYRLVPERETIVAKTHMPYRLSPERLQRWTQLFLDADYEVAALPGYDPHESSNPFLTFRDIPPDSRYRFMLEEARYTIDGFIKGPVCRGQVALNVINDYFWAVFVDPDAISPEQESEFISQNIGTLRLPPEDESDAGLLSWRKYGKLEAAYLKSKSEWLNELAQAVPVNLDIVWDGDGDNDNAGLTILRHFDSATVIKGLNGDKPQTVWLIGYTLLERLHYLLVAGFDIYGSAGHQLSSRLYMDYLRMEGEFNFLALLPKDAREKQRDLWYRDASDDVKAWIYGEKANFYQETDIVYRSQDPYQELLDLMKGHLAPVLSANYVIDDSKLSDQLVAGLNRLKAVKGIASSHLAEATFVRIDTNEGETLWLTLLANRAHKNIAHLFLEDNRRLPEEDTVLLLNGLAIAIPRSFMRVQEDEISAWVKQIENLASEADYQALMDSYGVRRTNPDFWRFSDSLVEAQKRMKPMPSGLFDYARLENR